MASVNGTGGAGSGLPIPAEFGVVGDCDEGPGVAALSKDGDALEAHSENGWAGKFVSDNGHYGVFVSVIPQDSIAVFASAADNLGTTGVYGEGDTGVEGYSDSSVGVRGTSYTAATGVYGYSSMGAGVLADAASSNAPALQAINMANYGVAIYATNKTADNQPTVSCRVAQTSAQLRRLVLATDETAGRGSTRGRHSGRILLQRY